MPTHARVIDLTQPSSATVRELAIADLIW